MNGSTTKNKLMKSLFIFSGLFLFLTSGMFSQKLIDEDFTDGKLDDHGSGTNGANWHIVGPGTDLRAPNNRDFGYGVSNEVSNQGGGWADRADWYVGSKDSNYYKVHKENDVAIVRMTTFSDYCFENNFAGVEVAFLEYRSELDTGAPHFGHDQSWETMACYYTMPGKGGSPNQLETNVENLDNPDPLGVKHAHKDGYYTKDDLDSTQTSLVIWRNMKEQKKCNIEQWGEANHGDFLLDTHMVALREPNRENSLFSFIQVTFFRGIDPSDTTSQSWLIRDGVFYDQAQIGINQLEVGITKRADFNLDYAVDTADGNVLINNWNVTGSMAHLQSGDATNDDTVDNYDASPLIGFWSADDTVNTATASGTYDASTGEVTLNLENISYFRIEGPSGVFTGSSPQLTNLAPDAYDDRDDYIGGFTQNKWNVSGENLGAVAATGYNAGDLSLVVNYKGSGSREGFRVPLNGTTFDTTETPVAMQKATLGQMNVYPNPADQWVNIRGISGNVLHVALMDMQGTVLKDKQVEGNGSMNVADVENGVYLLNIKHNHTTAVQKLVIHHD